MKRGSKFWLVVQAILTVVVIVSVMAGRYHCCMEAGMSHEECVFLTFCTD